MKKILTLNLLFVLLALCGCGDTAENKDTRFLLDTIVTLQADCDDKVLDEAFELCSYYERLLSRTDEDSEVYRLNKSDTALEVSDDTRYLVERSLYYAEISDGAFDVTIAPVSSLWNFTGEMVPDRNEIAAALRSVDYHSIATDGNTVALNGAQIDLGAIAKGYISDKLNAFFTEKDVSKGIINLGGNITVFGDDERIIGIKKPYTDDIAARVSVIGGYSVVTSGTYERYIDADGKKYHHILDPKTGYGVKTDLVSATIIGRSATDCDALSTVCILLGRERAAELIESTEGAEAVFITDDGDIIHTSGLKIKNDIYTLM